MCLKTNEFVSRYIELWKTGQEGVLEIHLNQYIELGLALHDKLLGIGSFFPSLKSRESRHMTRAGIFCAPKCLKYTEIVQAVSYTVG